MIKGNKSNLFPTAVIVILVIIVLFVTAFFTESKLSGMAVYSGLEQIEASELYEFAEGNYYIDDNWVVYWIDDSSKPAIAQLHSMRDAYSDRYFYVSDDGMVFYS